MKRAERGAGGGRAGEELLVIGQPAPAFALEGSDGARHQLAALLRLGHVALFFYPGNDTPG